MLGVECVSRLCPMRPGSKVLMTHSSCLGKCYLYSLCYDMVNAGEAIRRVSASSATADDSKPQGHSEGVKNGVAES